MRLAAKSSHEMLRQIALFRDLSEEELVKIERLLIRRQLQERQSVFLQGEPLESVYFIESGRVKIYRTDEQGREQVVRVLMAGDMFPHVGFFSNGVYPANAMMFEDGLLLALPTGKFRAWVEANPALCLKLMAVMESEVIDLQGRLAEMVMHNTFGRTVLLLLRLSRTHGEPVGDRLRLSVPFTNQELANMIGTTRESVNRVINQLKKAGAVETAPDYRLVLDGALLEQQLRM